MKEASESNHGEHSLNERSRIKPECQDEIQLSREQHPITIVIRISEAYRTGIKETQLELQATTFRGNFTQMKIRQQHLPCSYGSKSSILQKNSSMYSMCSLKVLSI